jgi:stage II sporulation protein M
MNRRYEYKRKQSKIKELIVSHLENNIKEYTIISIIFFIGIIIGIIFINKTSETQISEINNYIYTFVQDLKNDSNINELLLLKDSLRKNCVLAIFLWFMGSTVIGISIVYITICFRGFCLGYTISSVISSYGVRKGNSIFNFYCSFTKYIIYSVHNSFSS